MTISYHPTRYHIWPYSGGSYLFLRYSQLQLHAWGDEIIDKNKWSANISPDFVFFCPNVYDYSTGTVYTRYSRRTDLETSERKGVPTESVTQSQPLKQTWFVQGKSKSKW